MTLIKKDYIEDFEEDTFSMETNLSEERDSMIEFDKDTNERKKVPNNYFFIKKKIKARNILLINIQYCLVEKRVSNETECDYICIDVAESDFTPSNMEHETNKISKMHDKTHAEEEEEPTSWLTIIMVTTRDKYLLNHFNFLKFRCVWEKGI